MAEAVVEPTTLPTRYFCHMCNVEINIPNTDFTCPLCAGGFVEELPTAQPAQNAMPNNAATSRANRREGRSADWNSLRDDLTTLLLSRNGPNFEISFLNDGDRRPMSAGDVSLQRGNNVGSTGLGIVSNGSNNASGSGRGRPQNLDNVLFEFLQSLSTSDIDTNFGNSQLFFMGNPGDYAWGREGIDTIVTQLLNQMETSGPPPLSKEKIDDIPKVVVSAEDVEKKHQCSVCWEDFNVGESVRRLPCSHIYHDNCIVPWLNLHSTCPICRKSLMDEAAEQNQTASRGSAEVMTRVRSLRPPIANISLDLLRSPRVTTNERAQTVGGGNNSSSSSSTDAVRNSITNQGHGNIFGFDDSNMDMDMDLD